MGTTRARGNRNALQVSTDQAVNLVEQTANGLGIRDITTALITSRCTS